jgi:hypothetical protein
LKNEKFQLFCLLLLLERLTHEIYLFIFYFLFFYFLQKNKIEKTDMFVAGDNVEARETVLKLVHDLGFNPVDAGGIAASR